MGDVLTDAGAPPAAHTSFAKGWAYKMSITFAEANSLLPNSYLVRRGELDCVPETEQKRKRANHRWRPGRYVGLTRLPCSLAVMASITSPPALAAEPLPCPAEHQCFVLSKATLQVPIAYVPWSSMNLPGADHKAQEGTSFWFWMPDGAPAGSVREEPGFMYPDAQYIGSEGIPVDTIPHTLAEVGVDLRPYFSHGHYVGPDDQIRNAVKMRAYEFEHHQNGGMIVDPAKIKSLLTGTTATIENTDSFERFSAFHMRFGRAGCDRKFCAMHFHFSDRVNHPYPHYNVAGGDYAIPSLGAYGFIQYISVNDADTLAMAETVNRLLQQWATKK